MYKINGNKNLYAAGVKTSRFIEPHGCEALHDYCVTWKNAFEAAEQVGEMTEGRRVYGILSGRFVFCDFIGALLKTWGVVAEQMTISTLSMSPENVGTLEVLMEKGYVKNLDMIVSHYYFANERNSVIPILMDALDKDGRFQLAVASVHTKIVLIKTTCGKHITIHGSANLRTSDNIEQICIESCRELYDFNYAVHDAIVQRHKTINKAIRSEQLWQTVLVSQDQQKLKKQGKPQPQDKKPQLKKLPQQTFKAGA